MPGHVLHLCNLYCHCLSQPLPSLSFSVHVAHSITRIPAPSLTAPPDSHIAFLTASCPLWHICCFDTGFERFPLVRLPCWRYRWKRPILYFPKSTKNSNLTTFSVYCMSRAEYTNSSRARTDNRVNSVPKLYSIYLGTFQLALLICYPQRCWNLVIVILFKCCVTLATP
jgi:hypothetical protein